MKKTDIFLDGVLRENPVFVLALGTCPTLATTSSLKNAFGMGCAAAAVLICSNTVISLLRKFISDRVRIPFCIVVTASFVTVVQMLMQAFLPSLYESLGVYVALIVVNCIILGRAEAFALKNSVLDSLIDGASTGLGFLSALCVMGAVRELFGSGSLLGCELGLPRINVIAAVPGGFLVYGLLSALISHFTDKPHAECSSCGYCPGRKND